MTDDFLSRQDILEDIFTIQESDGAWGVTEIFLPGYKFVLISVKDGWGKEEGTETSQQHLSIYLAKVVLFLVLFLFIFGVYPK